MADLKIALGQTFGTKKAKKAIESNVINAISPQKKRADGSPQKLDTASKAILAEIGEVTSTMATREELQAAVDKVRPIPIANLDADEISDVYRPEDVIGAEVLNMIPVRDWMELAKGSDEFQLYSQFVARRLRRVGSSERSAVARLRLLRYLYFVVIFFKRTKSGSQKGTRRIPTREQLRKDLAPAPEGVIENIRRKFSENGEMRKFHIELLITHCITFACIIDNFEMDTADLRTDLMLDQAKMNSYTHEIGGRVKQVVDKKAGRTLHIAKLALPLDFPKQRHMNARKR
jgi:DNA-directed RNA polymerase I subunit RPA49